MKILNIKFNGLKIIEGIALNNKWINKVQIKSSIKFYGKCSYSEYLKNLIK
jgi:glucose-1-phosphate thymidylyltransferase